MMRREILTITGIIGLALAIGIAALEPWKSMPPTGGPLTDARAVRQMSLLIDAEHFQATLNAQRIAANATIKAGLEDADHEGVRSALKGACEGVQRCLVYDADQDLVSDLDGLSDEHDAPRVEATAPLPDGGGRVVVERPLGARLLREFATLTGETARFESKDAEAEGDLRRPDWPERLSLALERGERVKGFDWTLVRPYVALWLVAVLATLAFGAIVLAPRAKREVELRRDLSNATSQCDKLAADNAALVNKAEVSSAKLQRASEVLAIDEDAFKLFVGRLTALSERCAEALPSGGSWAAMPSLMVPLDSIKVNARLFNLGGVYRAASDLEAYLIQNNMGGDPEAVRAQLGFIEREVETLIEVRSKLLGDQSEPLGMHGSAIGIQWLSSLLGRVFTQVTSGHPSPATMDQLFSEYQHATESLGKQDLATYLARYERLIVGLTQRAGNRVKPLRMIGNGRYWPPELMPTIHDVLLQLIKNAVEHGIEAPHKRREAGKPEAGSVIVESQMMGGICTLSVRDDGRGFDKADGVGLTSVRESARALGGDVAIVSKVGLGTEVRLHFPHESSRFDMRLPIFNLAATVTQVVGSLISAGVSVRVAIDASVARHAIVTADRMRLTTAMREAVTRAALKVGNAKTIEIALKDKATIALSIEGGPWPALDVDISSTLFDGGFVPIEEDGKLLVSMAGASVFESNIKALNVLLVGFSHAEFLRAERLFNEIAASQFGDLKCRVHEVIADANVLALDGATVLIISGAAVGNEDQGFSTFLHDFVDAAPPAERNVVVVTDDATALVWEQLFKLSHDPLVVQGTLDQSAVCQAMEASVLRTARAENRKRSAPAALLTP